MNTPGTVEFYWDFGSPTSYLAYTQLPRIAAEAGARLDSRPVLLGGIFQSSGNRSPAENPAKARYMLQDLPRFARRYRAAFNHNPHFPINTLALMRGAIAYETRDPGRLQTYIDAVFRGMWVDGVNMGDAGEIARVLQAAGLDPSQFVELTADPVVKDTLRQRTAAAVERGLFGVPTMFVGKQMFFGQDRLDFVAEALRNERLDAGKGAGSNQGVD